MRRRAAAGDLDERRAALAIEDLSALPITRYPDLLFAWRAWELRHNLTPYDAVYVALGEALECPVLTADVRLSGVPGVHCAVEVLGQRTP